MTKPWLLMTKLCLLPDLVKTVNSLLFGPRVLVKMSEMSIVYTSIFVKNHHFHDFPCFTYMLSNQILKVQQISQNSQFCQNCHFQTCLTHGFDGFNSFKTFLKPQIGNTFWRLLTPNSTLRWPLLHFGVTRVLKVVSFPKQVTNKSAVTTWTELSSFDDENVTFSWFSWNLMKFSVLHFLTGERLVVTRVLTLVTQWQT